MNSDYWTSLELNLEFRQSDRHVDCQTAAFMMDQTMVTPFDMLPPTVPISIATQLSLAHLTQADLQSLAQVQ